MMKGKKSLKWKLIGLNLILSIFCFGQIETQVNPAIDTKDYKFFEPATSFDKKRFWGVTGVSGATYLSSMIYLHETWYSQEDREGFHLFDDRGEWLDMDKYGHAYSAYLESEYIFKVYQWTGASKKKSLLMAGIWSTAFQGTIEVFDGFATDWGFSIADIGMNTLGTSFFITQQALWDEQRMVLKYSNFPVTHPNARVPSRDGTQFDQISRRVDDQYGENIVERMLKDYNGATMWLSVNPSSFIKNEQSKFPKWLNFAVGVGGENMYGGRENAWDFEDVRYSITDPSLERYRQYYLSPDIDFTRIKTDSKFLRTFFVALNAIKMPAPALEINTRGETIFRPFHF